MPIPERPPYYEKTPPGSEKRWESLLFPGDSKTVNQVGRLSEIISLSHVQSIFENTAIGKALAETARFKTFFQPPDYPDKDWAKLIGVQGNDLLHGDYTRYTGDILLSHEPRAEDIDQQVRVEKFLFGFTNLTYDWGEAHPKVGDVPFGAPKLNRDKERFMRSGLARDMLTRAYQDIITGPEEAPTKAIDSIVHWSDQVAFRTPTFRTFNETDFTGLEYYAHLYRANKYIGHFAVALRMGRLLDQPPSEELANDIELRQKIEYLNALVSCNDLGVVIQYAQTFPGVKLFLDSRSDEVNRALDRAAFLFRGGVIPRDNQELPTNLPQLIDSWKKYLKAT